MSQKQDQVKVDNDSNLAQPTELVPSHPLNDDLQRLRQELGMTRAELKSLKDKSGDFSKREASITQEQADFKQREADLARQLDDLTKREAALDTREKTLRQLEGKLAETERVLHEKKIEAEAGFASRNREALKTLESEHALLREEMDKIRADALKKLRERLSAEEETRRVALDAELIRLRELAETRVNGEMTERHERFDKEIAQQRADVEHDRALVSEAQKSLAKQILEVEERQSARDKELVLWERRIACEGEALKEDREALEAKVQRQIGERASDLQHSLSMKDKRIVELKEERDRYEKQLDMFEDLRRRFGHKEPEEVIERLDTLEIDRNRLHEELARRPSIEDGERLAAVEEERRVWGQRRTEMARELGELHAREGDWLLAVAELERQKDLRVVAERRRESLQAEMEKLREEVGRLRSLYEQPKELEARIGVIERPRFIDLPPAELARDISEEEWLSRIHGLCIESGLSFPLRLLYAFHTSLKMSDWTPLTILGGVSGTGKSELPRLYARFGGLAFEPLSVQPNWDSPQSMFGFFNSVDNRFNATPLLRALVQSQQNSDSKTYTGGLRNRLLLVLLDEMNLAHVELYFSELLSKLELRRGEKEEDVTLDVDLGAGLEGYKVPLGRNVLWVGTMNEDETTKTLSDKVLDRANLLGFPRPRELRRRLEAKLADRQPMLAVDTWNGWICQKSNLSEGEAAKYKGVLEQINQHLEGAGRALGHRVWQAVESYIANYPGVRTAKETRDDGLLPKALRVAFEDALVHKVMPKLRGIETSGKSKSHCLDPIANLLANRDLGLQLSEDFELACSVGYAFVWRSAKYLEAGE